MARRKSDSEGRKAGERGAKAPAAKTAARRSGKLRPAAKAKKQSPRAPAKAKAAPRLGPASAAVKATPQAAPPAATAQAAPADPEGCLLLPHTLEISGIRDFHKECVRLVDREPEKVILDGREIAFIDTAGVQLLTSLVRSLQDRGCEVAWENFSVQVYQVAAELGLESEIGC